jgi:hypothetical protein
MFYICTERGRDKLSYGTIPDPTKIVFDQNCRNNFNIDSPTHPRVVHIKIDSQLAYDIQLESSWTPWKVNEITFPIELVPYPNSSGINRNHRNNQTSKICLGAAPPFLSFGPCIVSSSLGLCPRGTCTSLDPYNH